MNTTSIHSQSPISVDQRRARQTPRSQVSFRNLLVSGASTAARLVGMPTLSAAISQVGATNPGPSRLGTTSYGLADTSASGTPRGTENLAGGISALFSQSDPAQTLHDQRIKDDLKLIEMQNSIQQQSRQISLISNIMKARHDTAKNAIANIRA